jgi:sugar transferase (PEP-CTERM system associated)
MAKGLIRRRFSTLMLIETLVIVSAITAAAYWRLGSDIWDQIEHHHGLYKALLVAAVCQLCFHYLDLYDDRRLGLDRRDSLSRIVEAFGASLVILGFLYYWFPDLTIGRGIMIVSAVLVAMAVIGWRIVYGWMSTRVLPRERLLLVGTSAAGVSLARELHERYGVEVVGFVVADPARVGSPVFNPGVIGTIEEIPTIVRERAIDKVVVSLSDARGMLPMGKLLDMRLGGVVFEHLATVYEAYTGKIAVENLRPSWLIFSEGFHRSRWREAVKRAIDLVASAMGLLLVAPVLALFALLVKYTSPGPVLYSQERVGLHGRTFTVHKLRSMYIDAESSSGAVWSQPGDQRITPIGRFMRRSRVDELPQLWNVLKGEMSLVGPRPERPEFVGELKKQVPFYGQRHVVKPGLTGWAQVRYTYGASVEDTMEKLQYDLFYIKNFSIGFDLFIVFETIKTVVLRRGA